MKKLFGYIAVSIAVALSGVWVAAQVNLKNFTPGDLIKAEEVNANFDALNSALAGKQARITGECAAGSSIRTVNADGAVECEVDSTAGGGGGDAWLLTGNAGTTAGTNFLGTTDDEPFEIHVNGQRALRLEPLSEGRVNVILGDSHNTVADGVNATIGGGTSNRTDGNAATIGGGNGNTVGGDTATIGGGFGNVANGGSSTIAGGLDNEAAGDGATVGGGFDNSASGLAATVPGGQQNFASGSNSFAAGQLAQAKHDGTFVWSDGDFFQSTDEDQFLINADGGVAIGTNDPQGTFTVDGPDGVFFIVGTPQFAAEMTGSNGNQVFLSGADNAGFFNGDVQISGDLNVSGTLSKGAGSFTIDHPLHPKTMILSHSFVESPYMMNIYNGNITTDTEGYATVILPDYFQALNRDFRYQLTVLGQFAQAIVSKKIEGNQFVIRTNKPNVEVSWQVTGVREDPYALANPIVVEEMKPLAERGSYLHPKAYGLPEPQLGAKFALHGSDDAQAHESDGDERTSQAEP